MNPFTPKKNVQIEKLLYAKSQRTQSPAKTSNVERFSMSQHFELQSPQTPSDAARSVATSAGKVDQLPFEETIVLEKLKELSSLKVQKNLHQREMIQKVALAKQKFVLLSRKLKTLQENEATRIEEIQDLNRVIESLTMKFKEMKLHTNNMIVNVNCAQKTLISGQTKVENMKNTLENIIKNHEEITEKQTKLKTLVEEADQKKKVSKQIIEIQEKIGKVRSNTTHLKSRNDYVQQWREQIAKQLNEMDLKIQSQKQKFNSLIEQEKLSQNEDETEILKLQEKKANLIKNQSCEKDLAEKKSNTAKLSSLVELQEKELQEQKEVLEKFNIEKSNLVNKLQQRKEDAAKLKVAFVNTITNLETELRKEKESLNVFCKEKEDEENELQTELKTLHSQVEASRVNTKEVSNISVKLEKIQEKNKQIEVEYHQNINKLKTEYESIINKIKVEETKFVSIEQTLKQAEINKNNEIVELESQLKKLNDNIKDRETERDEVFAIVPTPRISKKYTIDSDDSDDEIDFEALFVEKVKKRKDSKIKIVSDQIIQNPIKLSQSNITDSDKSKDMKSPEKKSVNDEYDFVVKESPTMKRKPVYMTMLDNEKTDTKMSYDFTTSQSVSRANEEVPSSPVPKPRKSLSFLKRL